MKAILEGGEIMGPIPFNKTKVRREERSRRSRRT